MRGHTHKCHIVKTILTKGEKTATDFHYISNANQYFCDLVKDGILKDRWGFKGNARVKFRGIADRKKALAFVGKVEGHAA